MSELKAKVADTIMEMSLRQLLITFIIIGVVSGGTGHLAIDKLMSMFVPSLVVNQGLENAVTSLAESINSLDTAHQTTYELLVRTRCEVEAIRNGSDWRDCWTPQGNL